MQEFISIFDKIILRPENIRWIRKRDRSWTTGLFRKKVHHEHQIRIRFKVGGVHYFTFRTERDRNNFFDKMCNYFCDVHL